MEKLSSRYLLTQMVAVNSTCEGTRHSRPASDKAHENAVISVTFLPQLHDLNLFIRPKLRDILHGKGPVIYKSIKAAKVKTDRRHLARGELKREDS